MRFQILQQLSWNAQRRFGGQLMSAHAVDDKPQEPMSGLTQWLNRSKRPLLSAPLLWIPRRRERPERVAVTGAAGYIGNILTERLLEMGHSVVALDRLDFGDAPIRHLLRHKRYELENGDLLDIDAAAQALRDADAVIHLAAVVGDPACAAHEREAVETNLQATGMLAKLARGLGARRMLFASTCSVYGSNPETVDETSALNPVSLYAETKIDAERLVLECSAEGFSPTALRIGTAFGWSRRPRFDLLVNLLTAKARFDGRAVIFNGDRWRPFVHVNDIVRGFEKTLTAAPRTVHGRVFNLGSNAGNHRLSSIAEVLRQLHPQAAIELEETDDRRNYRVEFGAIERALGFRAMTSLEAGIREIDSKLAAGLVDDYRQAGYHNVLSMEERPREHVEPAHDAAGLLRLRGVLANQSRSAAERAPASRADSPVIR
jgi:nucleoside-diphosphate-sugar epimerase